MYESEKGFFEKLANAIPGLKGYREKESRRDTDKRLREYLASEVDRHRRTLEAAKRDLLSKGKLELLDDIDRAQGKMQRAGDGLRFATYGYAGFFDQVKVREEELDRLYQHDQGLLVHVRGLEDLVRNLGADADPAAAAQKLEAAVDALIEGIEARKNIFNAPA